MLWENWGVKLPSGPSVNPSPPSFHTGVKEKFIKGQWEMVR